MLDENGRFLHDGEPVTHAGMARAFARWLDVHPDDGRFILQNGYDWSYLSVRGVPYFVDALRVGEGGAVTLVLFDGSEEALDPTTVRVGQDDAVYVRVKGGRFEARLRPAAQTALAPLLVEGDDGAPALQLGGVRHPIRPRTPVDPPSAPRPS